jgi:hypothetical protein
MQNGAGIYNSINLTFNLPTGRLKVVDYLPVTPPPKKM